MGQKDVNGPEKPGDLDDPVRQSTEADQNQDAAAADVDRVEEDHQTLADMVDEEVDEYQPPEPHPEHEVEVTVSRTVRAPTEEHADQLARQIASDHFQNNAANKKWELVETDVNEV